MRFGRLPAILLMMACVAPLVSCSEDEQGANLDLSLNPSETYFVGTPDSSCADLVAAIGTAEQAAKSVTAARIKFSNFAIKWKSTTERLYIAAIRISIDHSAVSGGSYRQTIDLTEIESLLGISGAVIPPLDAASANPQNIYASTQSPKANGALPCGLQVGGITFTNTNNSPSFTARVKVEVFGTAENVKSGEQSPVKKSFFATAISAGGL